MSDYVGSVWIAPVVNYYSGVNVIVRCFGDGCVPCSIECGTLAWEVYNASNSYPIYGNSIAANMSTILRYGDGLRTGGSYYVEVTASVPWQVVVEQYSGVATTTSSVTSSPTTTTTTTSTSSTSLTTTTTTTPSVVWYTMSIGYVVTNSTICSPSVPWSCSWSGTITWPDASCTDGCYVSLVLGQTSGDATYHIDYPEAFVGQSGYAITWSLSMNTPANQSTLSVTITDANGNVVAHQSTTPTGPASLSGSFQPTESSLASPPASAAGIQMILVAGLVFGATCSAYLRVVPVRRLVNSIIFRLRER